MESGQLGGDICDSFEDPLAGVAVTVSGGSEPQTEMTNSEGDWAFLEMNPGTYSVTAELSGYVTQRNPCVQVFAGRQTILNFRMPPSDPG